MAETIELPPEIQLFHILPKLPLKSVFRFMCVSKQWRSFLKSPAFRKMHPSHHLTNTILLFSTSTPHTFGSFDCDNNAPQDDDGLILIPSPLQEAVAKTMNIIKSFHGLVCVGMVKYKHVEYKYADLILSNPSTWMTLSQHDEDSERREFGLCHRHNYSCDDNYKIQDLTYHHVAYIYSLKSDFWKKVTDLLPDTHIGSKADWVHAAVWNGKLYILKTVSNIKTWKYSITRFDMKTEKFTEMKLPSLVNSNRLTNPSFMVRKGCIILFAVNAAADSNGDHKMEFWRMNRDETWTELKTNYWLARDRGVLEDGTNLLFVHDRWH